MNNISADNIHMLITGGAGFIRSYLIEKLLEEGYEVIVWIILINIKYIEWYKNEKS